MQCPAYLLACYLYLIAVSVNINFRNVSVCFDYDIGYLILDILADYPADISAAELAAGVQHGVKSVTVDGKPLQGSVLPLAAEGAEVNVQVVMG